MSTPGAEPLPSALRGTRDGRTHKGRATVQVPEAGPEHDILSTCKKLESQLAAKRSGGSVEALLILRSKLSDAYRDVILTHPAEADRRGVLAMVWNKLYYPRIQELKKQDPATLQQFLMGCYQDFELLLTQLRQATHSQDTVEDGESEEDHTEALNRLCLGTLVYMGDVARYKEQTTATKNFDEAKDLYMEAMDVFPHSGNPQHQLGVLAHSCK
eukprot:Sspe_Gene.87491::Locus_58800_Transcript_1_1_Confidence_1.000_Length_1077::g.87491::m.87491